jgi:uncharacterized membrane protein (UPF0127 family)
MPALTLLPERRAFLVNPRTISTLLLNAHVAATPDARIQGLQGRNPLRVHADGSVDALVMLFDPPELVRVWNVHVGYPIDVLFFDRRNRLVHFAMLAALSMATVGANEPVAVVVELPAGSLGMTRVWSDLEFAFKDA